MDEQLKYLIEKYKIILREVEADFDETIELRDDDFNPADASGGNFDDCYNMGFEDGAAYKEFVNLSEFVADLETLKED